MKNLTFLLTLAFLFNLTTKSQDVKIGVFVDPQITWMSPESREVESEGTVMGIGGGLMVNKYFAKNYAFSTGMSIGTQGGKLLFPDSITITDSEGDTTLPANTKLDYHLQFITVPVGLTLKSNQIGYASLFVNVGINGKINIKAKASSSGGELNKDVIKKEISVFNVGYQFGGGIEFELTQDTSILVGIFYSNGLLDVTKDEPKVTAGNVALRLGIIF